MILRFICDGKNKTFEYVKENQMKRRLDSSLILAVNREDIIKNLDFIKEAAISFLSKGVDVKIVIDNNMAECDYISNTDKIEYMYSKEEIKKLIKFNNELVKAGMKTQIKFNEYFEIFDNDNLNNFWDLRDVVKANNEIDFVVDEIKKHNLSPYEAMLYIHKYVSSSFGYGNNAYFDYANYMNVEKNCSVVSAIKFKQIICVGYASIVKAIVDKVNDPNLKCEFQGLCCFKKSPIMDCYYKFDSHAICMVEINDEKYGIKGKYAEDTCADHKTSVNKNGRGFASCMFPISDLYNYGDCVHVKSYGNRVCSTKNETDYEYYLKVEQGEPIPLKTTIDALKVLYGHSKNCAKNEVSIKVERDIKMSVKNAIKCFKPYAKNPYVHNKYAEQLKSKNVQK